MNKYLVNFYHYVHLLQNLIVRDLKVKYRRSVLGFLWSILNPLLMMLVITAVFQNIFRMNIDNFPIYYLTGSLIFNFMSEATSLAMTSVLSSASLIKKVYIPKYIFPLEKCLFAFVNMLFSSVAVIIMFFVLHYKITWMALLFFVPMIFTFIFSIGLGLILSAADVFFRDIGHLYSVWITAWMYLTPVIYPMETLTAGMKNIMKFNPMFYYVDYFRQVVMYNNIPGLNFNLICFAFSFAFLFLGLLIFKLKQDKFILYI